MQIDEFDGERFVADLYRGILRREADPDARKHFVGLLRGGMSVQDLVDALLASDEFRAQQNQVVPWAPHGHFYSPIVAPADAERHLARLLQSPPARALPGIALDPGAMIARWHALLPLLTSAPFPAEKNDSFRYAFENPAYSWGDGLVLQAMIRHFRPARIVEIGSGWSSACMVDTVERYLDPGTELTFIEPSPELLQKTVGDTSLRTTLHACGVQDVPLALFESLRAGDILFIDSSHVLKTGSDVCFELFEILPRLAAGVVVHFHDIFWPFEYPSEWLLQENRSWNEAYGVRAFLTHNSDWEILLFNNYLAQVEQAAIAATLPQFFKNPGGALWLQRTA